MKLNLNTIVMIAPFLFLIFLFSLWYFKGTDYKKEYKKLEEQYEKIQKTRDSLKVVNLKLKNDFEIRQKEINKRDSLIKLVEDRLYRTKSELKQTKKELANWESDYKETKKKLDNLKKNPVKREGDDLLNSLKKKLK
jgi:hypothetical protein